MGMGAAESAAILVATEIRKHPAADLICRPLTRACSVVAESGPILPPYSNNYDSPLSVTLILPLEHT